MKRAKLIARLRELADYADPREWDLPLDLADILREAADALETPPWIPVEEDLPTTYKTVLISYRDDYAHPQTALGFLSPANEFLSVPFVGSVMPSTTHWMLLPEPPEEVQ